MSYLYNDLQPSSKISVFKPKLNPWEIFPYNKMSRKNRKIRLTLKAYLPKLLNEACSLIINRITAINDETYSKQELLTRVGFKQIPFSLKIVGPVALPTKKRIYCVLRSPHVNKDSREHFEIRTHKRLIDILSPSDDIINILKNLDFPSGVEVSSVVSK